MTERLIASNWPTTPPWHLVNWSRLASLPTPVLTWFTEAGREELSGANATRWVAKIANYVSGELGVGAHLALALPPSWRRVVWDAGAVLAKVEVNDWGSGADRCPPGSYDLLVTDRAEVARAAIAADPTALVLLHDPHPLAWHWAGELPEGAADAIAEVSSQPDGFIAPPVSPQSGVIDPQLGAWLAAIGVVNGTEIDLSATPTPLLVTAIAAAWVSGFAVRLHSPSVLSK